MIGHKIHQVLSKNNNFKIFNVSKSKLFDDTKILDLRNIDKVEAVIKKLKPNIVVNAAGLLIEDSEFNPLDATLLNSVLPLSLKLMSQKINFKLIQISTDCVFSGDNGPYNLYDYKDAKNVYGKTKALGEINDNSNLTIRTSVIGPDLKKNGKELFNWFMSQSGKVQGYTKSIWSGVTTLELAKYIEFCIVEDIVGIKHLSTKSPISKYELLLFLKNYTGNKIILEKVDGPVTNKVLLIDRNAFFYCKKSYNILIDEMVKDIVETNKYPHYNLIKI